MRLIKKTGYLNQTVSGAISGAAIDLRHMANIAVETQVGAGLTATIRWQGSIDGVNWYDMDTTNLSLAAAGSAINVLWNIANIGYNYGRLNITGVTGSGTVVSNISAKGF